ncbi:uncharacterized protein E5676_scaffold943G00650 [Cucumis melo var. makuwa]|uniref:Uncharacterized protein n=1 Tax=Cucumis melo var. makuwa TaxID=1194695 RepID=A0A5D3DKE0_CUCMM|nr:uncharacterized protein E6C27_scaffold104G00470 [Cucumis melo var. makuwa]TYK24093.1 uncharacterized protein E5676_scaffold943G00650 [Cucumis melo var. makuwa]
MPRLDPKVAIHRLAIKSEHQPVKQAQRRFRPKLISQIEEEVNKLIEAEFIREVKYPTWIANIVLVRKKNGKLRVCFDFRNLNNACPKDDFPLPIMEIMIDATAGHEAYLSWMGRATYQRAMQRIFDNILHKHVECYVDDLIVKSKKKCDHLKDLKLVLDRLRKYQLRMNPLKCAFGVTSGKFLGFILRHRGIEVDHSKIDAIQKMPSRCQPFQRLMMKDAVFDWDQSCQNAFDSIKKYLLNSSILSAPAVGKPLTLYIAVQETSLGALLAQENDKDKECALYYLIISERHVKWAIILQQYDIVYIPQKEGKGQALADFLADHPVPSIWKLCDDLPDEEVLFVKSMEPWIIFTLDELCSNNVAGYQALIISLQMASEFGIKYIEIFSNLKLIINQLSYQYEVKHQDLKPYFIYARRLMDRFDGIILEHIPRSENKKADVLANLATTLTVLEDIPINIFLCPKWIVPSIESQYEDANMISVYAIDEEDWRQPIINYLEHGKLPTDPRHQAEIRRRAARFIYYKDTLYRRLYEGLLLRCLGKEESTKDLEEAHLGICGAHQSGPKLQYQLKKWVTTGLP